MVYRTELLVPGSRSMQAPGFADGIPRSLAVLAVPHLGGLEVAELAAQRIVDVISR